MHVLADTIEPAEKDAPPSPRKLGRFRVSMTELARWTLLLPLMSEMVVVATAYLKTSDEVEYTAFCSRFETTRMDEPPPLYEYKVQPHVDGVRYFMRKLPT